MVKKNRRKPTNVTIAIIDSRSREHPEWVNCAIDSAKKSCAVYPVNIIVMDNTKKDKSIGYCLNRMVRDAKTEFLFFLDDDDWITPDIIVTCLHHVQKFPSTIAVNTRMTAFSEDNGMTLESPVPRMHKGLIKREYLIKYPFNETLKKGVDRAWFDQVAARGDLVIHVPYHYGYYYRQHDEHRARATGNIELKQKAADICFQARQSNFIEPFYNRLKQDYSCNMDDRKFDSLNYKDAKVIWCEWLGNDAIEIGKYKTNAKKILRVHAYEAFTDKIFYIDFDAYDKVIFVAEHIKEFVENKIGKPIENSIVIPNGVDLEKFKLNTEINNKIAFAGSIERKKGIGELLLIAEQFTNYEFHVAGTYYEEDVAEYLRKKKPDNVFFHGQIYDMKEFYRQCSYVINTSLREGCPMAILEGMASGCKPMVRNWIGADKIFPDEWIYNNLQDIGNILDSEYIPEYYRVFVEDQFNFEQQYTLFKGIIDESYNNANKNTC